jgi:hypothetical protein
LLIRDRDGTFTAAFDAAESAEQTCGEDDRGRPAGSEAGRVDVRETLDQRNGRRGARSG